MPTPANVLEEMQEFAVALMGTQTKQVNRIELGYNKYGYEWICHAFLAGALMVVSERHELPTNPREVAFIGLLNYITSIEGSSFKRAQERVATIYNAKQGSYADIAIEAGRKYWNNPYGLKACMETLTPTGELTQKWDDEREKHFIKMRKIVSAVILSFFVCLLIYAIH